MKIKNVTFLSDPGFNFNEKEIGRKIVTSEYLSSLYLAKYVEFKCDPFMAFVCMEDGFDKVRNVLTKGFLENVIAKIDSGKFKWLGIPHEDMNYTLELALLYNKIETYLNDASGKTIARVEFPLDSVELTPYLVAKVLDRMMRDEDFLDDMLRKLDSWHALPGFREVIEEML